MTVIHADSRDALKDMPAASLDACVCDPPYGLSFMGRHWDGGDAAAFDPAFWAEVLRVLKPGAHLIAFGGTRTYHRLVCAIEDAGFEIRDTVSWNFGSGFPKSHNVVKRLKESGLACGCTQTAVSSHFIRPENLRDLQRGLDAYDALSGGAQQDMRAGVCGDRDWLEGAGAPVASQSEGRGALRSVRSSEVDVAVAGASRGEADMLTSLQWESTRGRVETARAQGCRREEAQTRYATAQEPGMEGGRDSQASTWELQRRALCAGAGVGEADGAQGRLHHGASSGDGADVRLPADADGGGQPHRPQSSEQPSEQSGTLPHERGPQAWGGWPVCGGCRKPVVPEGFGTALKPAMELAVLARKPLIGTIAANVLQHGTGALNVDACRIEGTKLLRVPMESAKRNNPILRTKSTTGGSETTDVGRWPANVLHDGSEEVLAHFPESDGQQGDLNATVGSAARFFYTAKADADDRLGSKHPTVKPVDLMAYLVKLVTPPGGVVLDPFAGSGTTGMACMREGFDAVLIERELEYYQDILRRLDHVKGADTPLFSAPASSPEPQPEMALPLCGSAGIASRGSTDD